MAQVDAVVQGLSLAQELLCTAREEKKKGENQTKVNNSYTWERLGKTEELTKMAKTLTLQPSSAEDKKGCWGRDLGLQSGKRQFTWRWKRKCLINKNFLCQAETIEQSGL